MQVNQTTTDTFGDTSGNTGNIGTALNTILTKAATGGRFTSPTKAEIAEDGDPEYVIPVKKESIAVPLLSQLFSELSDSAKEALGIGVDQADSKNGLSGDSEQSGMFSGFSGLFSSSAEKTEKMDALSGLPELLLSASSAAAPVVNQNTTASVQAPVSINVTAAGSDPEAVGKSIYDVAERYLLRTLEQASAL